MIGDAAAVERAERAVGQLAKAGEDLRDKRVKLVSRIKQDELELAEVNSLLTFMQAAQEKTEREKDTALHMETQYNHLSQDFKVEEKALVAKTKAASQYVNQQSGISLNSFALAEKEGIRGYSSGPGSTCTRAEARAREQRAKLLRVQRNLATR